MARLDQNLGAAGTHVIVALVDKQPVIGADQQIAGIVERARPDQDRGPFAGGARGGLADPAQRLRAVIAGQNHVALGQLLDRLLGAAGHGDHRAMGEGHAGDLGKAPLGRGEIEADDAVIGLGAELAQRQAIGRGNQPLGIHLDQHDQIERVAIVAHEGDAAIDKDIAPGPAQTAAFGQLQAARPALAKPQIGTQGPFAQVIDIVMLKILGTSQIVAQIGAVDDRQVAGLIHR